MNKPVKWTLGLLLVLIALGATFVLYGIYVGNPQVVEEITNHPDGERAGIVMLLTFADGRTLPVNYLQEGQQVYVGADGPWWRDFREPGARVSVTIRGQEYSGTARVELEDRQMIKAVFARLRPSAPEWLPDWLNGKLVVITLD